MRISDWSSDVCSSDLARLPALRGGKLMRQSVQALCVVTFDAPAETDVYHLHDIVADALISGSHATVSPTEVRLMSLREEAAMFNSNGDQWESDPETPWDLRKGREHILSVSVPFDQVARTYPMKPADAAGMVAEALNFMAGRVSPPDAAAPQTPPRTDESRVGNEGV